MSVGLHRSVLLHAAAALFAFLSTIAVTEPIANPRRCVAGRAGFHVTTAAAAGILVLFAEPVYGR
jgi:hypothetical protein